MLRWKESAVNPSLAGTRHSDFLSLAFLIWNRETWPEDPDLLVLV